MLSATIPDSWWTSGLCSTFAHALQLRFGGDLWAIVNHVEPDDDQLEHAYCVLDGVAYDAAGPHPIAEVSDVSQRTIPEMDVKHNAVIQWRRVSPEWFRRVHDDYNPDDFPAANAYIDRHPHLFCD